MKIMMAAGLALAAMAAAAAPVSAIDTPILPGGDAGVSIPGQTNSGLVTENGILDSLYGLENLTRVSDDVDQLWTLTGLANGASAFAAYAGYQNTFGVIAAGGSDAALDISVLSVTGGTFGTVPGMESGVFHSNPAELALLNSGPFQLAIEPNGVSGPGSHSSLVSANEDGIDHMVTFKYVDAQGNTRYIVAFEDLQNGGDQDYNDLVLELIGVAPVPEPGTMVLLGSGLLGLAAWHRRRRMAAKA